METLVLFAWLVFMVMELMGSHEVLDGYTNRYSMIQILMICDDFMPTVIDWVL